MRILSASTSVVETPASKKAEKKESALVVWLSRRFKGSAGWMSSLLFHMVLILALGLWVLRDDRSEGPVGIIVGEADPVVPITEIPKWEPQVADIQGEVVNDSTFAINELAQQLAQTAPSETPMSAIPPPAIMFTDSAPLTSLPPAGAGGFAGRDPANQDGLLQQRGGSQATQDAVERALAWIAAQQNEDGHWDFNHRNGPLGARATDPGSAKALMGATGLALLPFLGKGYTHLRESPYQETVTNGLYYLRTHMKISNKGGDMTGESPFGMYCHGLAAIALCEAYAMTEDPELRQEAQEAVKFIEFAQHSGGGWRYQPGEPGDTSVFGWQLMALKSALIGGLQVSSPRIGLAEHFLDTVQSDGGANYGYQRPGKQPSTTAIGLLSRMYLGWKKDDRRLLRGTKFLAKEGPSKRDMYYNYYATNVMAHQGGPDWTKWNDELSNYLIKTQSNALFDAGSWRFDDPYIAEGGRLYTTCLAAMILEVYYRHMPLYSDQSIDFKF
ncbi:terpene cyclase/mutase family protein [Blastopirellula sp. JC732]|uniref:Terpene cyclase/mutase family protein n=1 Tax=Blastopirellula sediminis TaxID=2894196 RepID=A0A9X1SLY6_9BACT|nr:prenyltransferase/squalene oxidase repeat-containing protein [Blastopirellula sediminis]MCC9605516.1 terpene cyclase/mutase family protein [Blastopirellula sediminis]MCC9631184.1 terpene cyclase/mutase family protein [Blastopirellula sediminis]